MKGYLFQWQSSRKTKPSGFYIYDLPFPLFLIYLTLSYQLDYMYVCLIEGKKLVEFGEVLPKDIEGYLIGGLRSLPCRFEDKSLPLPVMFRNLVHPPLQVRKRGPVGRADNLYGEIPHPVEGGKKGIEGIVVGIEEVGAQIGRNIGKDMVARKEYPLIGEVKAVMSVGMPRCGNNLKGSPAYGPDLPRFQDLVNLEGGGYPPEMAEEVIRLFKETDVKEKKILAMAGHEEGVVSFGKNLKEAGQILLEYFEKAKQ